MLAYFYGVRPGERAGHACYDTALNRVTWTELREQGEFSPWFEDEPVRGRKVRIPLGRVKSREAAFPGEDELTRSTDDPTGEVRLLRAQGWTLAFLWDRSGDGRPGSASVFALKREYPVQEALPALRSTFPAVWDRMDAFFSRAWTPVAVTDVARPVPVLAVQGAAGMSPLDLPLAPGERPPDEEIRERMISVEERLHRQRDQLSKLLPPIDDPFPAELRDLMIKADFNWGQLAKASSIPRHVILKILTGELPDPPDLVRAQLLAPLQRAIKDAALHGLPKGAKP